MNVPTLPTDNLYKFRAITGIVIVIATLYGFGAVFLKFDAARSENQRRSIDLELDLQSLVADMAKNEKELDRVLYMAETLTFGWTSDLGGAALLSLAEYEQRMDAMMEDDLRKPTAAEKAEIWKILTPTMMKTDKHREKLRQSEKVRAQIEFSTQQSDKIRDLLIGLGFATGGLVLFGIGLARRGFKRWAVIQELQDAILVADAEDARTKRAAQEVPVSPPAGQNSAPPTGA